MDHFSAGGKTYVLQWFSGTVVEQPGKHVETSTYVSGGGAVAGGGGYVAPVTVSTTSVVHDQVFLRDRNGKERAFQLKGFNLAARLGHELSVVWAT